MMNNRFLKFSFILILSIFVCVIGENKIFASHALNSGSTAVAVEQSSNAEKPSVSVQNPSSSLKSIPEKNKEALERMEKKGLKQKLLKFIISMCGVLLSSVAIFAGLKIYKNLALKNTLKIDTIDYEKNLESPKDFREAINLFLDKTDR